MTLVEHATPVIGEDGPYERARSGDGLAGRADPDVPLIVLTRDADRPQRIRVLERGGDDVVRKPFAYPELRARIAAVLRPARRTSLALLGAVSAPLLARPAQVLPQLVHCGSDGYRQSEPSMR